MISVGEYKHYNKCRFCNSEDITSILNLGYLPLAGGFLKDLKEVKNEKFFPLELYSCSNCSIVSVFDIVPKEILFNNYFYSSSTIPSLVKHFEDYSKVLKKILPEQSKILEIGCNDGVLLNPLSNIGFTCIGVDPCNLIPKDNKNIEIYNGFFNKDISDKILSKFGKVNCVTSSNCFAHIEDMNNILVNVCNVLDDNGILVIEVHYLLKITEECQYDMVYHEHMTYYSLTSIIKLFERYNLIPFNVDHLHIHSGSLRIFSKFNTNPTHLIDQSISRTLDSEMKINRIEYFFFFSNRVESVKNNFLSVIKTIRRENLKIYGYGASGRANTIMGYCGITNKDISYMIDDSPLRVDCFTPYNHIPIVSPNILISEPPDYIVLFAWSYKDYIIPKLNKFKGKIIIPLPEVYFV